eukprot:gene9641-biopygen15265
MGYGLWWSRCPESDLWIMGYGGASLAKAWQKNFQRRQRTGKGWADEGQAPAHSGRTRETLESAGGSLVCKEHAPCGARRMVLGVAGASFASLGVPYACHRAGLAARGPLRGKSTGQPPHIVLQRPPIAPRSQTTGHIMSQGRARTRKCDFAALSSPGLLSWLAFHPACANLIKALLLRFLNLQVEQGRSSSAGGPAAHQGARQCCGYFHKNTRGAMDIFDKSIRRFLESRSLLYCIRKAAFVPGAVGWSQSPVSSWTVCLLGLVWS